jgi:WD40 repeat protein
VATGERIASLDGRSTWLPRVVFSADGRVLAAAGSDNHIRMWEMSDIDATVPDRTTP